MNPFKRCRELSGYTQKEVSITLKVSIQAVSYWEQGMRMPSYKKLIQVADLYGVTTDELLGRTLPSAERIGISADEKKLLDDYRQLNRQGQDFIRQTILTAVSSQIYKNSDNFSSLEAVKEKG